jgi:hypothetical protein
MATQPEMNYVVGRGRLYFDKFVSATDLTKLGERYLGDTPSLGTTQSNTDLKHYSSEQGLKVLDRTVTLQNDITGTFVCDNIDAENLAFWYAGDTSPTSQAPVTSVAEVLTVQPGLWYQIGATDDNPFGVSALTAASAAAIVATSATGSLTFSGQPSAADTVTINGVAITFVASGPTGAQVLIGGNAAGTAQALAAYIDAHPTTLHVASSGASNVLTLSAVTPGPAGNAITLAKSGTNPAISGATLSGGSAGSSVALTDDDWTVEMDTGRFMVAADGSIAAESVVTVTYSASAAAATQIVTARDELYGALRFVADNPVGLNTDYYWPYVKLAANGEFALKGDAWQQMSFNFDVLKLAGQQRVRMQQRAA